MEIPGTSWRSPLLCNTFAVIAPPYTFCIDLDSLEWKVSSLAVSFASKQFPLPPILKGPEVSNEESGFLHVLLFQTARIWGRVSEAREREYQIDLPKIQDVTASFPRCP